MLWSRRSPPRWRGQASTSRRSWPVDLRPRRWPGMATGCDVDLVVVGHRGRGALARLLLGSVADRLVQICPKPVLIVH